MLKQYFQDIFNKQKLGDAREESYYSTLEDLLKEFIQKTKKKFQITILPKKTEAGNPDFRIWDGKQKIVGYIEAKDISLENLDLIEESKQLKKYLETFPNLILTNFFEFRLYRNGNLIKTVTAGRPFMMEKLQVAPPVEHKDEFQELLKQFFSFSTPRTTSSKQLAIELAKRTRFLRNQLLDELTKEEKVEGIQILEGFYKAFKEFLLSTLTIEEFANLFAQTVTYGLFVARSRSGSEFNRKLAHEYIPKTIGILRDIFQFISSTDLPISMVIIDDIAEILAATDVKKIIDKYYKENKGTDPIIHFYETFLTEYDPKEREKRGVYYTPLPVVDYIVRSVQILLKEKLDKKDGFADPTVTVLDPASGTLTFPAEAIRISVGEYKRNYGEGSIPKLIEDHILEHFFAFELMMAPYAVGHLKISLLLEELGYTLKENDRFKLYLTNTLEMKDFPHSDLPLYQDISDESEKASQIKKKEKVIVVIGNPPYSVSSSNKITKENELFPLYESYKENVRKEERNIQPLSDDYIKFIAFAHYKIKQAGSGIIGMITNNSYLDGIIHRDMRKKLMDGFDQIYILNLHGSSKRKETTPDGGKDENVFDIQQGVSIILLIKGEKLIKYIKYADIYGLREIKYKYLEMHDVKTTEFQFITPQGPYYFLKLKNQNQESKYNTFLSITQIFRQNSASIVTGKDDFLTDFDPQSLKSKITTVFNFRNDNNLLETAYKLSNSAGKKIIQKRIKTNFKEEKVNKYHYRPFDYRYIYYEPEFIERSRSQKTKNMLYPNLSICVSRITVNKLYNNIIASNCLSDYKLADSSRGSYFFPLYLYDTDNQTSLLKEKLPNINWINLPLFIQERRLPEQVFYYIYAVLYSNIYRQKYQEFLKIDFPKVPFTKDEKLYTKFAEFGEQLVNLHLLKSKDLDKLSSKFQGKGENQVEKREYQENEQRIHINSSQYFENVKPEVWNYFIGGYQVLDKWLKDRKNRFLSSEDVKHYCKVITTLAKTIELQKEIDKCYQEVEINLTS